MHAVGYKKMEQENKKNIISKIIYWVISSLIIILLFLVIFGLLPVLIENINLNITAVIGLIIGGVAIIIIALYKPLSFMKHFIKKDTNDESQYNTFIISLLFGFLGVFLLLGGLIYSFTENSTYLVLAFGIPVVIISVVNKIMSRKQ